MLNTKYKKISKELLKIFSDYKPGDRLPGIQFLAKKLSVAPQTVTRAVKELQKQGTVSVLGTRGTFLTDSPEKEVKHSRIALVGYQGFACTHEFNCIEKKAIELGYSLVAITANRSSSFLNSDLLKEFPADGYILASSMVVTDIVLALQKINRPFVSLNKFTEVPGINWVDYDSYTFLEDVLNNYIRKGHSKIAYVNFKYSIKEYSEKMMRAYKETLERWDVFDESLWVMEYTHDKCSSRYKTNDYHRYYGRDAIRKIFKKSSPTAAIVPNSKIALGMIEELKKMNLRVPEDFSITTLDNPEALLPTLPVEFVALPRDERAEASVEILDDLIKNPGRKPVQKSLKIEYNPKQENIQSNEKKVLEPVG